MTVAVSIGLLLWLCVGTGEGWGAWGEWGGWRDPREGGWGALGSRESISEIWRTPQYSTLLHRVIVRGLTNDLTGSLMLSHDTLWTAMGAMLAGSNGSTEDEVREGMTVPSQDGRQEIPDNISSYGPYPFEKKPFVGVYLPPDKKPRDDFEDAMRDMGVDLIYSYPNNSLPRPTLRDILLTDRDTCRIPAELPQPEVFVLTAATYRAGWEDSDDFSMHNYRIREFNVDDRRSKYVNTMYSLAKQRQVAVLPHLNAKMLLLPLKHSRVKFMVILPALVEGLQNLEDELQYQDLRQMLRSQMDERKYDVILPIMKILTNVELAGKLGSLKVTKIFDPKQADLSRISSSRPSAYVRRFQHVTKLLINGKGINLIVDYVDSMSKPTRNDPGPAEHFYATHPFFFALLDEDQIFATGRYGDFPADPASMSNEQ